MPQMGYDTKTDRLTDCQSQCDSDSDIGCPVIEASSSKGPNRIGFSLI
jgi:hypothetical protein